MYIYVYSDMAVSLLFLYVRSYVLICCTSAVQFVFVLCDGFSLFNVQNLASVMCGFESVLCAELSLCYVRASVCTMCAM